MSNKTSKHFGKDKYIDFKVNGRLFPSWVLANFKKFKLPEIITKDDEDPCDTKGSKLELRKYQVFASKFLDYRSPYQDILIYHGLGSGKTISAINIYNMLYNYTPGWNVFILIKATLKDHPWMSDLEKALQSEEKDFRMRNITFISYDSPTADRQFLEAVKNADTTKKNLYIFDETHNFISNVYSNISSRKGRRALNIYDYIIQDKTENPGVRVVLLSATPAINRPFEVALLFNLLRPGSFPKSETQFNQMYVTDSAFPTINPLTKNLFQRRIIGLVSYYIGSTPDLYARKTTHYLDIPMSKYQEEIYDYFEEIEEVMAAKKKAKQSSAETYKSYTRQSMNFVFPAINQRVTGENRPRPNKFRITEKEAEALEMEDKLETKLKFEKGSDTALNVQKYKRALEEYVETFDEWLSDKQDKDKKNGHTLKDDVKIYLDKYKGDYEEFSKKEIKKSSLYEAMYQCSGKFLYCVFNIMKSAGPVLFYSNYVLMEGIQIFKVYLKYFGFGSFSKKDGSIEGIDYFRYTEYHGMIEKSVRKEVLNDFNNIKNVDGKLCKIIMISPAGAEGLSLRNVRQVHLIEPYWHEVRMLQMVGRAIRACYHKDLPMKERHVDIYRYKSIRTIKQKQTTDQYIENVARSKQGLIESFYSTLKEVAIDCELYKAHNMMEGEYKCFKFDEPSLFDDNIGPSYMSDYQDDIKISNGSNSVNSQTIRIRVKKINAVKQLTKGGEGDKALFSKPTHYWFNPETGVVYDYDLYYAIGKVGFDDDNIPKKIDKDTYIIDKVIPIPLIDEEVKED
jgi:superfamily II DNA or RNA helicase